MYSFERYMGPTIISEMTRHRIVEIFVEFIRGPPPSSFELAFVSDGGVMQRSSRFKEGDLVHWNLDMYVHLTVQVAALSFTETD